MEKNIQKEIIKWKDIGCVVKFEFNNVEYGKSLEFWVYEIVGEDELGNFDYEKKGAKSSDDTTEDMEEAQTLFRGLIKWDGCSHVYFGDEEGYIHLCGFDSWNYFYNALNRVWEYATKCGFTEDDFEQVLYETKK